VVNKSSEYPGHMSAASSNNNESKLTILEYGDGGDIIGMILMEAISAVEMLAMETSSVVVSLVVRVSLVIVHLTLPMSRSDRKHPSYSSQRRGFLGSRRPETQWK